MHTHISRRWIFVIIIFGTYKYDQLLQDVVCSLSSMVHPNRIWYKSKTGHSQKFISVWQDIWDSKRHEVLGISLMFIHLEMFESFKVSAGLVHITGKKAGDIVHNTLNVFKMHSRCIVLHNNTCSGQSMTQLHQL